MINPSFAKIQFQAWRAILETSKSTSLAGSAANTQPERATLNSSHQLSRSTPRKLYLRDSISLQINSSPTVSPPFQSERAVRGTNQSNAGLPPSICKQPSTVTPGATPRPSQSNLGSGISPRPFAHLAAHPPVHQGRSTTLQTATKQKCRCRSSSPRAPARASRARP